MTEGEPPLTEAGAKKLSGFRQVPLLTLRHTFVLYSLMLEGDYV